MGLGWKATDGARIIPDDMTEPAADEQKTSASPVASGSLTAVVPVARASTTQRALLLLRLMRPHQWLKNIFVFAGLLFGGQWEDAALVAKVLTAFAAFCAVSSAVYVLNDWIDRAHDAQHPSKMHRPLASGAVSPAAALALASALLLVGLALAGSMPWLLVLLVVYGLVNIAYSLHLKRVAVVDVSAIASGFLLRLLAGTVAVGIAPSRWMLLTGLFGALFLGFCKRRAESFHPVAKQRAVMADYPPALLDVFIAVTMAATLSTYALFATSDTALAQHGESLAYTVPVVVFAMLRYTWQVHRGLGEDVARDLLRDPWVLGSVVLWVVLFVLGHR